MSTKVHVTIVDDDQENLKTYEDILADEFNVSCINEPMDVLRFIKHNKTDLILLDLHMPQINGFELYEKIKEIFPFLPVIFFTGDPNEEVVIKGLKLGAEDFILKPVRAGELIARIQNKIKSKNIALNVTPEEVITIGDLKLYTEIDQAEINHNGVRIQLTPIEFKIIYLLAKNPNKLYSRDFIINLLWPNSQVQNQNIDTHLSNLRKKLFPVSKAVYTIKGRGYMYKS